MRSVLEAAVREFTAEEHIRNVLEGAWVPLHDEDGKELEGIRGRMGAVAVGMMDHEIGVDCIEMQPGAAFALHVHPGDHILYILEGIGLVHVDGNDHHVRPGDSVFIPAEKAHGVKTYKPPHDKRFLFLAFGHPHKHVEATDRMTLVREDEDENGKDI